MICVSPPSGICSSATGCQDKSGQSKVHQFNAEDPDCTVPNILNKYRIAGFDRLKAANLPCSRHAFFSD